MSFYVNAGSESRMETAVAEHMLASAGCTDKNCKCAASWDAFKKDPTYDHYMRAHRIKVGKMEAVSPPGFGGTVKHMQENHKNISNPHALAWYQYEKGDKSHIKAPKGTGAKTVSKKTASKRSKALKKKDVKAGPLTPTTTTKDSNSFMERSQLSKERERGSYGQGKSHQQIL